MKVLLINSICGKGSTGRICIGIAEMLKKNGHSAYIAYAHGNSTYPNSFNFSKGKFDYYFHNILSRLTDSEGLHSTVATKSLIQKIEIIQPDIVHIHTMHGHYLNYKLLLEFLSTLGKPVVMTLHDCWTFTGHCAHFDMHGCMKWQTECHKCQFLDEYPISWFIDRSKRNFNLKKQLFSTLGERLILVPVSFWLENLLRKSFLKNFRIQTIHNGIDLTVFKPSYNLDLYEKYKVKGKKIVLGVALPWSTYKGFSDFIVMRSMLNQEYAIFMVGVSTEQINALPEGIIGITRTDSPEELAQLYTMADVLVNTTYCDNYPTVNLESIACGTPVITYLTGGSPESIDKYTGAVVAQGDINALVECVKNICSYSFNYKEHCLAKAKSHFDREKCFEDYVEIYKSVLK